CDKNNRIVTIGSPLSCSLVLRLGEEDRGFIAVERESSSSSEKKKTTRKTPRPLLRHVSSHSYSTCRHLTEPAVVRIDHLVVSRCTER
ncbi:hypothetical protein TorRG33x02_263910, partial [Trema orientale]